MAPQLVPSQVDVPFITAGHGLHDMPHEAVLALLTHAPPQAWNPALHETPQAVPSHDALPLAGAGHAVHEVPQVAALSLRTQVAPHR